MARNFRTNLLIGGDSRSGVQSLRRVQGEMDRTSRTGSKLSNRFRTINRRGLTLNGTLGKLGLTLSAGFVVGGTVRALSRVVAEADEIGKKARNIGIAAEALQELRGAGQLAGLSVRDVDDALRRFNRRIGLFITDGTGPAAKSVERLNLQINDAQGNFIGAEAAFAQAIDRIAELPTTAEQAAEAAQLFGDDAGPKLVTLLSQGSAGVEELRRQVRETGSVMSDEAIAAAEDYADAAFLLNQRFKGITVQVATGLIPGLTGTFEAMSQTTGATNDLQSAGAGLATSLNVVIRALIIIRETALAVGEVLVGLAVTAVGTIRQILAPIEGTIRTLAEASQALIDGNLRGAATAVRGLGSEITTAFENAQAQTDAGLGFIGESIETRVNNAVEGVARLAAGLDNAAASTGDLNDTQSDGVQVGQDWQKTAREMAEAAAKQAEAYKEAADAAREWDDKIADLAAELDGPLQKAVRSFQRDAQAVGLAFRNNVIEGEAAAEMLDLLQRRFEATRMEIGEKLAGELERLAFETLPPVIRQMLGLADATGKVTREAGALTQIGTNFATAVLNGQGIQDSLSSSLTAFGGQGIGQALESTFEEAATEGLSAAFKSDGFKKNSAEGFALALGQAVQGDIGQAAFTAVGNAIGGPIGALIGSIIGDAIFGESVPKFQVRGTRATRATDAGTDLLVNGPLGNIEFAFRDIADQAQSQIVRAFTQFDQSIASIIRDEGDLARVRDALDRFGVSSRSGPDDIEGQLRLRFDAILGTFDTFTQQFVNVADTLEGRVQRLADIFAIENRLLLGQGFGLTGADIGAGGGGVIGPPGGGGGGGGPIVDPGFGGGGGGISPNPILRPAGQQIAAFTATVNGTGDAAAVTNPILQQTLLLLDELSIGGESLVETFNRLTSVVGTLDTAIALTGGRLADTRAGLVRFGADLAQIFGDDASVIADRFGVIFESFFSDEERFTAAAAQARAQGENLLRGLLEGVEGVDFADRFLTQSGFRELFDTLLQSGNLTAEQLAILSEAGVAIAGLIDAEQTLADARREQADDVSEFLRDVGAQALQVVAPARLQFAQLMRQLEANAARAQELNLAESQLNIVRLSAQIQTQAFIAGLTESVSNLRDRFVGEDLAGAADQANSQIVAGVQNMRDAWLSAIEQISRALDDQAIGPNSSLTNRERLNETQRQLRAAVAAAEGGDLDAAQQIGRLFNTAIAQGASFFGTSTNEFQALESELRDLVGNADITAPAAPPAQTARNTREIANSTRNLELSAFEQLQLATQLVDQIGLLARLTGDSPSEIGEQFDIPIGRLIEVMTGEVPEATGDALASLFDNVVAETSAQLDELAQLEGTAVEQLSMLDRIREISLAQLQFWQGFEGRFTDKLEQFAGAEREGSGTIGGDASFGGGGGSVTAMATGGIVTRPTLGLVGEAGPEAVIPLSRLNSGAVERRLERIESAILSGNADRRTGVELTIEEQEQVRRLLEQASRRRAVDDLRPGRRPGGAR